MSSTLSVRDLCKCYRVTEHTVLGWIRSGELKAINVGRCRSAKKPRWRFTTEAVAAFELLRVSTSPSSAPRRKKRSQSDVIEFYR